MLLPMKTRRPTTALVRTYIRPKVRADGKPGYEAMLVVTDSGSRMVSTRRTARAAVRSVRTKAGVVK
jgi:hypothetical protein